MSYRSRICRRRLWENWDLNLISISALHCKDGNKGIFYFDIVLLVSRSPKVTPLRGKQVRASRRWPFSRTPPPKKKKVAVSLCAEGREIIPIWIKFGMVVDISNIITDTNFGDRRLKGFWVGGGSNFPLSHWLSSSPLQHSRTIVRACDLPSWGCRFVCDGIFNLLTSTHHSSTE